MENTLTRPETLSLVEQARRLSPPVEQPEEKETGPQETRILSDGYRRVSPVQSYTILPPSGRGRIRRIVIAAAMMAGIVALLAALIIFMFLRYVISLLPKTF